MTIHSDLIEGCKRGNSKAQSELYRLYSDAMYNVSRRILHHEMEAEEAMQEAFFKAFDKIDSFRNEVTFGAWLKRIVVNTSLDYLKRRKPQVLTLDEIGDIVDNEDVNDHIQDTLDDVKRAMAKLPEGYGLAFNLRMVEGYEYSEIAQMMGTTQSNIRSQVARAKRRLIEILQQNRTKSAAI